MLFRSEWLRRTDPTRPWQGLSIINDRKAEAAFQSLVRIKVGDGRNCLFWKDSWVKGCTVKEIAPAVLALVGDKAKNGRSVADGLRNNSWLDDLGVALPAEAAHQLVLLWLRVSEVQCRPGEADVFEWPWSLSGGYTAKSTYDMLCQGRTCVATASCTWETYAPLKCKIFVWLADRKSTR